MRKSARSERSFDNPGGMSQDLKDLSMILQGYHRSETDPRPAGRRHPLRAERNPQISCRTDAVVKGRMKRSKSIVLSSAPASEMTPATITAADARPPAW